MDRAQKATTIAELKERFGRMTSAVFLDFTGMNVAEVTQLRDVFRARGVEYRVVKNTLVKKALAESPASGELFALLRGMTGVAWSYEEPGAAARVVKEFRKSNEKLKVKAGLLDGAVVAADAVETQLASLPSRDEARAMLLSTMLAPAQQLLAVLEAPARDMLGVLTAKQRKDEGA